MSVTDVNQFRDVIDAYNAADRTGFTIEYALTISARARMFSIVSAHGFGPLSGMVCMVGVLDRWLRGHYHLPLVVLNVSPRMRWYI